MYIVCIIIRSSDFLGEQKVVYYKKEDGKMDTKTTGVVAYLTWIGLLVAFCAGDKEGAKFHINQSLVIMLFSLISIIPCIGWLWAVFMVVCWFIGFIGALNGEEKAIPLLGSIRIIK